MKRPELLLGFAGVIAMASLAVGCVPALNYGSVPPEPEYTTRFSTTTAAATTRKPFTTHSHAPHTISWGDYYGYATRSSTRSKSTTTGNGSGTSYHTTSDDDEDVIDFGYTTKGSGTTVSGESRPETQVTATAGNDSPQTAPVTGAPETAAPETAPPQTAAPETAPPQTAAPETAPPQTAAPPPQTAAPVPDIIED